ncbi:MAG TPA: hypothetical protein VGK78_16520 [Nocardioides sp.]|uniref:SCO7613 C-terminal domain-containing membrane protein n=1 Tax=Nocardioides sp. TaxID=35761 RepID=UPI002F4037CA
MTTYADPDRCPDCHALLPRDPQTCRVCSLPLTGETAGALFRALQEADRLLGVLRTEKRPAHVTVGAPAARGPLLAGAEPYPATYRSTGGGLPPRLRAASVPKILLSLGALCLLVAAVIFLAVAWSWLGVGGRTSVLVALTGAALGLTVALHRRGLRMAAEALAVVGLGLIALDVVGVRHAGWIDVDDAGLTLLGGAVVATGALLLLVATARRPLVAPALVAPVSVLVAGVGAQWNTDAPVQMLVTVVVLLGLGRVGTLLPSTPLRSTAIATAVLGWLGVVVGGLNQTGDPVTATHYFGDLACWPILAATVVAAAVGPVTGVRRVELGGYAVAGLVGTYGVLLPVVDNGQTPFASALLAAAAIWVVLLLVSSDRLRPAALLPLAGTLVVPVVAALRLVAGTVQAVGTIGEPFSRSFDVHVAPTATELSPLLLVPALLTTAAAGCAAARLVEPVRRSTWTASLATAVAVGGVLTLPLYDVPLALVVGALIAAAAGLLVVAERLTPSAADDLRVVVLALTAASAMLALPSDVMVTGVLVVACPMAAFLMGRTDTTGACASLCFPLAFAGLVWAGGNVVGVDEQFRAIPVLVVLGGLAIWRPRLELEASSAVAGTLVSAASVLLADDLAVSLAVHLTVAGALVTASSIIHPARRPLAWPGGLLLAAATWVRLVDLGVHVPEAYTLPSALALVVVGARRLRQDDESATLTVLAPGLALATVPSLLAMLDDPYSLRALLLGAACVVLAVAGPLLRWSAPVVVGAAVGTVLVLRELAPYAAQVPTWISIGIAGALLLVVGVTWESRMNDVRRASRYVAALR